jgi:hypothetical protein
MKKLNDAQRDELISQYCELVVDNMDMDSLVQYAQEQLANYFDKLSDIEIKEDRNKNYTSLIHNLPHSMIYLLRQLSISKVI